MDTTASFFQNNTTGKIPPFATKKGIEMANANTKRNRKAGKAGYGVKTGLKVNSGKARKAKGKTPWLEDEKRKKKS